MPPEAPAAAPPSSTVRIVDAPPPRNPITPPGELRPADIAAMPGEKREPLSSRESVRANLAKRAKPSGDGTIIPTPVTEPKPEERPGEEPGSPETQPKPEGSPSPEPAGKGTAAPEKGKGGKPNPWKLYEGEKSARATAEAEVQRLKTSIVPEQERTSLMARVEKSEKRAQELENEIRFRAYEKSSEYVEKYQQPYEAAWKRATKELSEIAIKDPISGQDRAVTSDDLLQLVNLPLGQARGVAKELFGDFADDVMAHRKEIRGLFDKQNEALEKARTEGGARDQQQREAWQKQRTELSGFVQTSWKEANDAWQNDPANGRFFKPIAVEEGKEATPEEKEWNESLERGYKLVDEAWGMNVMDAKLTPEQRKEVVRKNAAVRARAAAFGPLKRLVKRHESKIAALEKDLKEYTGSTPAAGGGKGDRPAAPQRSGMDSIREAIRKRAH